MLPCSDPDDMSKGSCGRINVARRLDALTACTTWAGLVAIMCEVK